MIISPEESLQIKDRLPGICGQRVERQLERLYELDTSEIQTVAKALRRSCTLKSLWQKPLASILTGAQAILKKFNQFLSPCSPIVALVGPDGVGKSTTIDHISSDLADFTLTITNHWRPAVLPRLGWFIGNPAIEQQPNGLILPRRDAGRLPLLRLSYYCVDYILGYYFKDRLNSSRQRLIIYDRCALDMAVDPARFGLPSPRGTRLLWRLIPKPDLVILLHDDPDRIHARKAELPVAEIARQSALWLQLVAEGEVDAVVRVDAGPEEIADQVEGLIIEKFIEKNPWAIPDRQADISWLRRVLQGQE